MTPTPLPPHLTEDEQKQQHRQYELFDSYHLLFSGLAPRPELELRQFWRRAD